MKNLFPILLLLIALMLGALGFYAASFHGLRQSRPVKLATTNWEPFVGPDLKGYGPTGELITETIHRMGFLPELEFSSWKLCLDKAENELVIGTFPGIVTKSRERLFLFSDPILTTEYVIFFVKSRMPELQNGRVTEGFNIRNYQFGKVKGYEVWEALNEAVNDSLFTTYFTIAEAFQALADGEIDFLPEGKIPGLTAVHQPGLQVDASEFGFLTHRVDPVFGDSVDFHLLMPKNRSSEIFLEVFNDTLRSVLEKSSYQYDIKKIEEGFFPAEQVELQPLAGASFPEVIGKGSPPERYRVPLGTRALVIRWPDRLMENEAEANYCQIKLLNGPLRGRIFRVDPRCIYLTSSSY